MSRLAAAQFPITILEKARGAPLHLIVPRGLMSRFRPLRNVMAVSSDLTVKQPGTRVAFSRHAMPEVCRLFALPSKQRAQGKPDARCTRGPVSKLHKKHAHEHTGPANGSRERAPDDRLRQSDFPCAMVLQLMPCSPRRPGFLATVARAP